MADERRYSDRFWHVHVRMRATDPKRRLEGIVNDLSFDDLTERVVRPWRERHDLTVEGVLVRPTSDTVEAIRIVRTPRPQSAYADAHNARMRAARVGDLATNRRMLPFSADDSHDFTDDLLFSADSPGSGNASRATESPRSAPSSVPPPSVFVVHGHDTALRHEVTGLLQKLNITPVVLLDQTGRGRTLVEKLEANGEVGFAIVLATPDDLARPKRGRKMRPRSRQNVILELGYFIARLGRGRVCLLRVGDVELPSDMHGVEYVPADAGGAWKMRLAREMKDAGLAVDLNQLK